jgi:hypothetical protein
MASLLLGAKPFFLNHASGAYLGEHAVKMSDVTAGKTNVNYDVTFVIATPGTLGSVQVQFCSNGTLPDDPCDTPNGFDASAATILNQSGVTDFTIDSASANSITLTHTPAAVGADAIEVEFGGITNPTSASSFFAKVLTYASADASGPYIDNGGMAIATATSIGINTEVPPYLTFCLGNVILANDCSTAQGDYVNVGDMGPTYTSTGQTQLLTATNAKDGYGISVLGPTMTSGNNEIPVITPGGMSVAGISQFGINLRANTNPSTGQNPTGPGSGVPTVDYNQPNHYRYVSGDTIASSANADDYRRYTVSYVINVGANQPPGVYASTFTYVCLANF